MRILIHNKSSKGLNFLGQALQAFESNKKWHWMLQHDKTIRLKTNSAEKITT